MGAEPVELLSEPLAPNDEPELDESELVPAAAVPVVAAPAATVPDWLDAYAAASRRPSPPVARVEVSRTPAVQRRVLESARLVRFVVMVETMPGCS